MEVLTENYSMKRKNCIMVTTPPFSVPIFWGRVFYKSANPPYFSVLPSHTSMKVISLHGDLNWFLGYWNRWFEPGGSDCANVGAENGSLDPGE